jgi:two-component system aerobic respiration control protein ArcA
MTKNVQSIRTQIEALKRQKLSAEKVVDLAEYRKIQEDPLPPSLLVVEDDEVMRHALKRMLETEHYQVHMAQDGLELSKLLEINPLHAILMDVHLPWVDGYELCKLVKQQPHLKTIPIVLTSGYKNSRDIERAFQAGADAFLPKPFDTHELLAILRPHLSALK